MSQGASTQVGATSFTFPYTSDPTPAADFAAGSAQPYYPAWWTFTLSETSSVHLDVFSSDTDLSTAYDPDTLLWVYDATNALVGSNDDVSGRSDALSGVDLVLGAGTYTVVVGLYGSTIGDAGTAYVLHATAVSFASTLAHGRTALAPMDVGGAPAGSVGSDGKPYYGIINSSALAPVAPGVAVALWYPEVGSDFTFEYIYRAQALRATRSGDSVSLELGPATSGPSEAVWPSTADRTNYDPYRPVGSAGGIGGGYVAVTPSANSWGESVAAYVIHVDPISLAITYHSTITFTNPNFAPDDAARFPVYGQGRLLMVTDYEGTSGGVYMQGSCFLTFSDGDPVPDQHLVDVTSFAGAAGPDPATSGNHYSYAHFADFGDHWFSAYFWESTGTGSSNEHFQIRRHNDAGGYPDMTSFTVVADFQESVDYPTSGADFDTIELVPGEGDDLYIFAISATGNGASGWRLDTSTGTKTSLFTTTEVIPRYNSSWLMTWNSLSPTGLGYGPTGDTNQAMAVLGYSDYVGPSTTSAGLGQLAYNVALMRPDGLGDPTFTVDLVNSHPDGPVKEGWFADSVYVGDGLMVTVVAGNGPDSWNGPYAGAGKAFEGGDYITPTGPPIIPPLPLGDGAFPISPYPIYPLPPLDPGGIYIPANPFTDDGSDPVDPPVYLGPDFYDIALNDIGEGDSMGVYLLVKGPVLPPQDDEVVTLSEAYETEPYSLVDGLATFGAAAARIGLLGTATAPTRLSIVSPCSVDLGEDQRFCPGDAVHRTNTSSYRRTPKAAIQTRTRQEVTSWPAHGGGVTLSSPLPGPGWQASTAYWRGDQDSAPSIVFDPRTVGDEALLANAADWLGTNDHFMLLAAMILREPTVAWSPLFEACLSVSGALVPEFGVWFNESNEIRLFDSALASSTEAGKTRARLQLADDITRANRPYIVGLRVDNTTLGFDLIGADTHLRTVRGRLTDPISETARLRIGGSTVAKTAEGAFTLLQMRWWTRQMRDSEMMSASAAMAALWGAV